MSISIKCGVVPNSEPKRFRERGRLHRNIRIYLHSEEKDELDNITKVIYILHPTFKNRYRESSNRIRNFEIRIWTYGYFKITAELTFSDGKTEKISDFVKWPPIPAKL